MAGKGLVLYFRGRVSHNTAQEPSSPFLSCSMLPTLPGSSKEVWGGQPFSFWGSPLLAWQGEQPHSRCWFRDLLSALLPSKED